MSKVKCENCPHYEWVFDFKYKRWFQICVTGWCSYAAMDELGIDY